MPPPAVDIRNIEKIYPGNPAVRALKGINLTVPAGSTFCILGPNGAGKTTLISLLCGLLIPDAGGGSVCGLDLLTQTGKIRSRVNLASGHANFPDNFTVEENLTYFGMLYGIPRARRKERTRELIAFFELEPYARTPFNKLSTGIKQRLALAKSLINDPELLFLDEPTVGLDPRACLLIRSRIRDWSRARGVTIILTTHQMDEAEQLSEQIAFMKEGRFVRRGKAEDLKKSIGFQERLTIRGRGLVAASGPVEALPGVSRIRMEEGLLECGLSDRQGLLGAILDAVLKSGGSVDHVEITQPTLGDVFLALANSSDPD